ncbi:MAG: prephenate dehydrogenase [Chloroflexi bacterium]|nr:prephenate dehydrogenase [Chloroflexota bacterium]
MTNENSAPDSAPARTICIVGIGLMGASFALALKARGYNGRITGVSRSTATRDKALQRSVVDFATTDLAEGVRDADVIVLCTPVRLLVEQIAAVGALCRPGAIITDMGSTKSNVIAAMNALPAHVRAIGSHPMCGKETAGIDVAEPGLYENAPWILTRSARTDDEAFAVIQALALLVGARPREIDVTQHDALLAHASHLPWAVSTAMVYTTDHFAVDHPAVWQVTAGGYRDTSRVAASDVTMWTDIALTNQSAILAAIRDFQFSLDQLAVLIERGDEAGLRSFIERAAVARKAKYG